MEDQNQQNSTKPYVPAPPASGTGESMGSIPVSKTSSTSFNRIRLSRQRAAYAIVFLLVVSGVFVYMHLRAASQTTIRKGETNATDTHADPTPTKYVKEAFRAHDFQVTLNFDANASGQINYDPAHETQVGTYDVGLDELDITGKAVGSSKPLIVSVIVRDKPTLSTVIHSPQAMQAAGVAIAFNTKVMGKQHTAYYYYQNTDQLLVNVPIGKSWYEVDVKSRNNINEPGYPITQAIAAPILNSISIQ